jgi:hypothetical protein
MHIGEINEKIKIRLRKFVALSRKKKDYLKGLIGI